MYARPNASGCYEKNRTYSDRTKNKLNRIFWIYVYQMIIFPVIFFVAHLIGLFSKKVRDVLREKYSVYKKLNYWLMKDYDKDQKNILFHAASLGEFEHIRPVLFQLKKHFNTNNIITFFSPSGFQNVKTGNGVDYFCYMPFDTISQWKKIYQIVNPVLIIVAKHDVWPAQIWTAKDLKIPVYLINASLSEKSTRSRFPIGRILSVVYRDFTEIITISEQDKQKFASSFTGLKLLVAGDTKYDQVLLRKEKAEQNPPLNPGWCKGSKIFVGGSIWPEDETHLLPALRNLLEEQSNLKIILVPHEPTKSAVARLQKYFSIYNPDLFSALKNKHPESRVLVIDHIGNLAALYYFANIAYVGGSFKQGIHNTMEPAVYGIPVLYGPVHNNSYEAIKLLQAGGSLLVRNQEDIRNSLYQLIVDDQMAALIGKKAQKYALGNTGATEKLINVWKDIIKG